MKGYRKPSGAYIEVGDTTPVHAELVEVALRPSSEYIWNELWHTNPRDPATCWRLKTTAEVHAERDAALQKVLDGPLGMAMKSVVLVGIEKAIWAMTDIRTKYRNL